MPLPTALTDIEALKPTFRLKIDPDLLAEIRYCNSFWLSRTSYAYLKAYAAYLPGKAPKAPTSRFSGIFTDYETGRLYVRLGDELNQTMAVYRVDRRYKLKRLRRWPVDLEIHFEDLYCDAVGSASPSLAN